MFTVTPPARVMITVRLPPSSFTSGLAVSERRISVQLARGAKGDKGDKGDPGPGIASGGAAGEFLVKRSELDADTEWRRVFLYGTGDPPDPAGITDGAVYFKVEE